jgi:uncharacterized protein YkwD
MLRRFFVPGLFVLCRILADPGPDENRILMLVNRKRRERGIRPLVWDDELARAARTHSERMATLGFFGHDDPDRGAIGERLGGVARRAVAENLHRSYGYSDPAEVAVDGWMMSQGHRRNLLSGIYTRTGIGVVRAKDGSTFATQIFSSR